VTEKLAALQKAKELPGFPIVRASVIDAGCGAKFCWILLHLSRLALRVTRPDACANLCFVAPPVLPPGAESADGLLRTAHLQEAAVQAAFVYDARAYAAAHKRSTPHDNPRGVCSAGR